MKKINILIILITFMSIFNCKAQERQPNISIEIIGTWIGEDDTKVKLIFKSDGTYLEYYDNELLGNYNYSIGDSCGNETDVNSWFLKAVDKEDKDEYCYELYGANFQNNNTLSMRSMSSGKIFIYNKS